ncbi:MAG: alpha/beta hydrolase domain-containing protein, partial [Vicinamibacterales bacterium]
FVCAGQAAAEVVRIDVTRRDDFGSHTRIIGRVHFAIDPTDVSSRDIADIQSAPRNAAGLVEFSSDLLFFQPKDAAKANGTVFLEVVNRGRDQSLGLMSDARTTDLSPEAWDMGDRFVLEQGFTTAFLGWQFDVEARDGLTFTAPVAPVEGLFRATYIDSGAGNRPRGFAVNYCAADPLQADATLTFRARFEDTPTRMPRDAWRFTPDGCAVLVAPAAEAGVFEAVYTAKGSPVAGLGLAALRDFASYLKYGGSITTLRETPALSRRVIGFGYSQSGRLLREFVRDGFNRDVRGRQAFDGLVVSSAGAGGGSFNHRFAMPGQAGNSVLSILRPVDLPPFQDEGLLARARADRVVPRIFYTFTSTEYWARAGSLTQTTDDGARDVELAPTSRLYFLGGTAHSSGPQPKRRNERFRGYQNGLNFAEQRWVLRALLLDLDAWVRTGTEPPPSRYPRLAAAELVARERVKFPTVAALPFAAYLPPVFRMDLGAQFSKTRIITNEPPLLGAPYPVLVPQVDNDGNDVGGVPLPEIAVPLGTFTGWNVATPLLPGLRYLAGLIGSFEPFARTRDERERTGDPRPSIAERYQGRAAYLDAVRRATDTLIRQRFVRAEDRDAVVQQAAATWDALAN